MTPGESSEKVIFGKLLPANPDIQEILKNIREKYDLPEIEEGDDPERNLSKLLRIRDYTSGSKLECL